MDIVKHITSAFVQSTRNIFGDNLYGIYLHGSAVMGCFNEEKSDIDLLVVVNTTISDELKLQFMNMVVDLNKQAPKNGLELSIVKRNVCKPFIYPTPYELHFSAMHLQWFINNPQDYINKMNGTDKDLAAHTTIIKYRGKCLYGAAISEAFGDVNPTDYLDSIQCDIENAVEDILIKPTYIILNLCRVLAYKKNELVLSKKEGVDWGIQNLPKQFHCLILQALGEYMSNKLFVMNPTLADEYARYMLKEIGCVKSIIY